MTGGVTEPMLLVVLSVLIIAAFFLLGSTTWRATGSPVTR